MAKDKEKGLAFTLFTKECLNAKEIAVKVGVTEKTVGRWIKDGNWKKVRDANQNQSQNRLDRIQEVIDGLSTERLEILARIKEAKENLQNETNEEAKKELRQVVSELSKDAVRVDNGIAMWNKTLQSFHKETKVSLSVYIEVQNRIFEDLRSFDEDLYMKTLEFQQQHILSVSEILN